MGKIIEYVLCSESPSEFKRGLDLMQVLLKSFEHSSYMFQNTKVIKNLWSILEKEEKIQLSGLRMKALYVLYYSLDYKEACHQFLFNQKNEENFTVSNNNNNINTTPEQEEN